MFNLSPKGFNCIKVGINYCLLCPIKKFVSMYLRRPGLKLLFVLVLDN